MSLLKRIELMTAHCERRGAGAGGYWKAISDRIVRQLENRPASASWYSSEVHYPATFSGAPFNGGKQMAAECERDSSYYLAKKVENALMRLPFSGPLMRPLWRSVQKKQRLYHYLCESAITYNLLIRSMHLMFREEIEKFDLRSPECYGPDLIDCDGRKLSYKTLRDFNYFLRIQEFLSPKSRHFVEIGCGIGELARIFLTTGRAERYVVVDIPPTLAYSEQLLSSQYPPEKLSLFDPDRKKIDFADPQICYFLTPDQLSLLPAFDAGINIASFGEMTRPIVSKYVDAMKSAGLSEFISINQRLGKDHNVEVIGESQYASFFAPQLRIREKRSFPNDRPLLKLSPDVPGLQGYQLLHFTA